MAGWDIPFTAATQFGEAVHDVLETYFKTGVMKRPGEQFGLSPEDQQRAMELAMEGLAHYPPRSQNILIEAELKLEDSVVPVYGRVDFINLLPDCPSVIDHKTTSAWRWMKTTAELEQDPQSVVYTRYAMQKTGAKRAIFKHIYYLTDRRVSKGRTQAVGISTTWEQNEQRWARYLQVIEKMRSYALELDSPTEVPANYEACNDYGGCPFRAYCALHKGGSVSIFKNIKKAEPTPGAALPSENGGAKVPASNPPAQPAPTPVAAAPTPAPSAVNPPEGASIAPAPVAAPEPVKKGRAKKAEAPTVSPLLTLAVQCLPAVASKEAPNAEADVRRAFQYAKEFMRQAAEHGA